MDAYMALTIHFIKKATWQRKSAVLQCRTFAESHTAENLLLALESAFSEYKIKERLHLVVRDNAANIVKSRERWWFETRWVSSTWLASCCDK